MPPSAEPSTPTSCRRARIARVAALTLAATLLAGPAAHAATPAELLAAYTAMAKAPASAERGQKLFMAVHNNGLGVNCAGCHGAVPVGPGRDAVTEKPIAPLAPAANPARLTDRAKVDHWFRVNCRDVIGRDCSAGEKADILAWLISLKPQQP